LKQLCVFYLIAGIMHEMSIAQSIFTIVADEIAKYDVSKVTAINIMVGEMSAVVPSSLSFCFDILTQGSPLEGARLNIEVVPIKAKCNDCGTEFEVQEYRFVCPRCESHSVEMLSGRELTVQDIEVE